jgi:hypothetical protein
MVTKSRILGFHPIDIHCARPSNMAQYTFTKYWKQFSPQQQELKKKTCLGKDKLGFFHMKMNTWCSSQTSILANMLNHFFLTNC